MMNSVSKPILLSAALLGFFGVAGTTLVSLTYIGTEQRIIDNERATLMREINKLVPPQSADNDLLNDYIELSDPMLGKSPVTAYRVRKNGAPVAVVLSPVQAPGYASPISLIIAVMEDGSLGGVRVLKHQETPGLGDKIEESRSDWILGFTGKSLSNPGPARWKVKRDGGDFDQFTGATITPRGIVAAVKNTLIYYSENRESLFREQSDQPTGPEQANEH